MASLTEQTAEIHNLKVMKRLYLLRHAKSSWDDESLADFDRPLNDRGLRAAPFMGELMADRGIRPDLIVSSPAERAKQTALLAKEASGFDVPIKYDERVYEASPQTLRTVVSQIPEESDSALLVGHNPGMEGIVRYLTGELQPMPTAALASIKLSIDKWESVDERVGILEFVIRPKEEMKKAAKGE
jgi:phosphohistidine phosphatase